jgi:tight adherence protein B
VGALSVVVTDAPEPSKSEFTRVVADEQLGVNLEDALAVVVHRMDSRDLDQVALVARLQRETGASSAEVLERVVDNVRDRQDVRRLVRTLTAQGRLSGIVLVGPAHLHAALHAAVQPPLREATVRRDARTRHVDCRAGDDHGGLVPHSGASSTSRSSGGRTW